ncbi:beta-ketoacyl-[acyl-carrier-protein] synthase family protein [Leeia sp.]|uniref:beta-ketoacyl-[acyl-carrier-protein] synthase family protein n=1 Tax=Leeia sp. TaxID=2884678 RepID=UPI0035B1FAF2
MKSCYLTRPGLLCALGADTDTVAEALFAGQQQGLVLEQGWLAHDHNAAVRVGRVAAALPILPPAWQARASRNNRLLLAAVQQIMQEVERCKQRYPAHRIGVVLGTSTSGVDHAEWALEAHAAQGQLPEGFQFEQIDLGDPARFLADWLELTGPAYCISTACTSGGKALVSARNLVQSGMCDAVITGGVDTLCRLTLNGFTALESTTSELTNPLSLNRAGINIGEGAAVFILSAEPGAVQLLGAGESSDAYHISAPEPEGLGASAAMQAALRDAGLDETSIGYLNLHATATIKNDAMESKAVDRVFPHGVPVSGTKGMTGHALGAAGALEAAFCYLSLTDTQGRLPPHCWDGVADPALPALPLVQVGQHWRPGPRYAMSNSFAFGGNNLSLILGGGA